MLSSTGTGELLFTPRVAALYGYTLLWALLAAVALKWFINREIGRFSVCTGATILEGFARLPGPRNWALWLILAPQFIVAIVTVAGMAGAAATAAILVTGGSIAIWMSAIVIVGAAIVLLGGYGAVEKLAVVLGVALSLAVLAAAISVFPEPESLARGLVPQLPPGLNVGEVLPWLGFMLAGAAGLMWFSYWIEARGYGSAGLRASDPIDPAALPLPERLRLRGWVTLMTITNTLAVVGALTMALAFLILGGELLRPHGLVPAEEQMAAVLGRLLGDVWGPVGFWFMIGAVFVIFCSTTLSVQDGFGRMFGDGLRLLGEHHGGRWTDEAFLRRTFTLTALMALPVLLYQAVGKPVVLLQIAGATEAAHIPIVTVLTLYLNHRALPIELQPTLVAFWGTAVAAGFFAVFAILYLLQLLGVFGTE